MQLLLNDTKWDEVRLAMYELADIAPRWRTRDLENGHLSEWDVDWFYHFRSGGYRFIEWAEIEASTPEQRHAVLKCLDRIHVPGEETSLGFKVFGYAPVGMPVEYLQLPNKSAQRRPPSAPPGLQR